MFEELAIQDARPIRWLKRVFVFVIVALLVIGAVSPLDVSNGLVSLPQPCARWR